MASIESRVKQIIIDQCGARDSDVTPSAFLTENLGMDSLDVFELVVSIEEEWGITIPDDAAESIKTVGDVIRYLESKLS
jgi:acyl carrier protein